MSIISLKKVSATVNPTEDNLAKKKMCNRNIYVTPQKVIVCLSLWT